LKFLLNSLCLLLIITPVNTFAEDVIKLDKGTPAPYTGYLFSPETEQKARLSVKELSYYKELNIINEEALNLYSKRLTLTDTENLQLRDTIRKQEDVNFWKNTLYFVFGAVITGAIAIGVNR